MRLNGPIKRKLNAHPRPSHHPRIPRKRRKSDERTSLRGLYFGQTITFGRVGEAPYGIEQYQENRRVFWQFIGGECMNGDWYESKGNICFRYDYDD